MKIKKKNKIYSIIFLVSFVLMLVGNTENSLAFFNWVEYDGYVHDDWGVRRSGAKVRLKDGTTTLDWDITDGDGYFYIKEYVESSNHYTLQAKFESNENWTIDSCTVLGRSTGEPWPHNFTLNYVTQRAVIVGICDYKVLTDEKYSDKDAADWYDQLTDGTGLDYDPNNIEVLINSSATEIAIKAALTDMVSQSNAGDILSFIFSGKGDDGESGNDYSLSAYDTTSGEQGEDGDFNSSELASILENSKADRVFLFLSGCHTFGMKNDIDELDNANTFFLAAATDEDESSYYDTDHHLSCWTQCFLHYSWNSNYPPGYEGSIYIPFGDIFDTAVDGYEFYLNGDTKLYDELQNPQIWNPCGYEFYLSKYMISIP